jgi:hypothetical protein
VSGAQLRRVLGFGGAVPLLMALAAVHRRHGQRTGAGGDLRRSCKDSLETVANPKGNYGESPALPRAYVMNPRFFAGEPIEDIKKDRRDNRLIIRLQTSGKRVEVNDLLVFDVVSNLQGRPVRARRDPDGESGRVRHLLLARAHRPGPGAHPHRPRPAHPRELRPADHLPGGHLRVRSGRRGHR